MFKSTAKLLGAISLFFSGVSHSQNVTAFTDWDLQKGANIQSFEQSEVININSGKVYFKGDAMQDGIIEFDLFTGGERAFVYAYFRQQSDAVSESIYLRTHKSNAPDTIQYSPVIQGRSSWQLYHGQKGTASAFLPEQQWMRVKLSFKGDKLNVWVGEDEEPVMQDVTLMNVVASGGVMLRGFIPRASNATYAAKIKNVRITPLEPSPVEKVATKAKNAEFISKIEVSAVFKADKNATTQMPEAVAKGGWKVAKAEADGMFNLLSWRDIPKGVRPWTVATRFVVSSETTQTCELDVGYSDTMTLHLNNSPIVFADASYRYSDNRQEGLLHPEQLKVYLPLQQGDNEVVGYVADSFGGWGVQYRLNNCADVEVKIGT